MDLCDRNDIQALLARHGFRFAKALGQNFLIEGWVAEDIAAASGADADTGVVEVGPGIGSLTTQLARRAGKVTAVELDKSLLPILSETLTDFPNAEVVPGDVMKLDLKALAAEHLAGLTPMVCANLPYNITTPVITAFLEAGCFSAVTVMIQREVARRICAAPGTSDYGAFSLFCQYYAETELLFDVPPECFLPAPKVTSAVIRCKTRPAPPVQVQSEAAFWRTVRAGFALRRKTLVNSLQTGWELPKDTLTDIVTACGLEPTVRGERLGLEEYARLSDALLDAAE